MFTNYADVYRQWRFVLDLNEMIRTSDVTVSINKAKIAAASKVAAEAAARTKKKEGEERRINNC